MSKYTIEVYSLLQDKNFKMFDFDYDFYTDNQVIKSNFENKFLDTYMFHELGQETVIRFKHFLKTKLNNIAPYYKQLYETELRCQDIDFMLNKDLTETFERTNTSDKTSQTDNNMKTDLTNKDVSTLDNTNNTTLSNRDISQTTNNSIDDTLESNIEQGLANISLNDRLTNVSKTTNETSQNNTNDSTGSTNSVVNQNAVTDTTGSNVSQGTSRTIDTIADKEITKLISQGNIGVTSSAELLDKWRKVIINIDNLIINECLNLFMQVY